MLTIDLPQKLEALLSELALKTHQSESFFVRKAVEHYFEDQHDYLLALQRLEEMEAEGDEGIPFEDVLRKHKLDD
jgi:predicted DNA-binding protein